MSLSLRMSLHMSMHMPPHACGQQLDMAVVTFVVGQGGCASHISPPPKNDCMPTHMCIDMCEEVRTDMYVGMCIGIFIGMCLGMCLDM